MSERGSAAAMVEALGLDEELAGQVADYPEIIELGLAIYTPRGLGTFLRSPQARFAGRIELDLIAAGQAERVLAALAADHEGLGY